MQLTASDFYRYYRPTKCELRVYLRHRGEKEAPPGPFDEVIRSLGERHEKAHLAYLSTFPSFVDLSKGPIDERIQRTQKEVKKGTNVIYHPFLKATKVFNEVDCVITGEPDFLINEGGWYKIRDSKISRRINEEDHPEIMCQLGIYGWLFEQVFGQPPIGLEVHSGTGDIVDVTYDGGETSLGLLQEILTFKMACFEPLSPVGWSKCSVCGFYERCWPNAEKRQDVALLAGVDQGLAKALRNEGIRTVDEFLAAFNEERLAGFQRPWGKGTQRVGKRAGSILQMARAMASGKEFLLQTPRIPDYPNYVMFDLEGIPPQLDELDKIYLWGTQVFGENPSEFQFALAGFGVDGDRQGWEKFLNNAQNIFENYGDIPFVHWHSYERGKLDAYIDRFGDPEGIAVRVRQNLLDLYPITKNSIALPLPSYSLKVVEKYVGFERTQEEYGGDWAMAKYIEAIETEDKDKRDEIMDQILKYNQEDLEATWAFLKWLKSKI